MAFWLACSADIHGDRRMSKEVQKLLCRLLRRSVLVSVGGFYGPKSKIQDLVIIVTVLAFSWGLVRRSCGHGPGFAKGHSDCSMTNPVVRNVTTLCKHHAELLCLMNCPKNRTIWGKGPLILQVYRIRPALTTRCGDYFRFCHMVLIEGDAGCQAQSQTPAL